MPSANTALSTLASPITATAGTLTMQTGDHVKFPPNYPYLAVLGNPSQNPEFVRVTALASDTLSISRGQRQTTPQAWGSGTTIQFVVDPDMGDVWGLGTVLQRTPSATNTAQVLAAAGTIATANLGVSKISSAGAVASIILQAGTFDGQTVEVVNTTAFTITFAASGTSFVADGVSDIIAAITARRFVWEATTALWYREG